MINKNSKKRPNSKKDEGCAHADLPERPSDEEGENDGDAKRGNVVLLNDRQISDFISFRAFFGNFNFFKIFRSFYRLANVPADAQNNPFSLRLDKNSLRRSFKDVFGIDNNELAIRFLQMFTDSIGLPKMHKVDIIRFY